MSLRVAQDLAPHPSQLVVPQSHQILFAGRPMRKAASVCAPIWNDIYRWMIWWTGLSDHQTAPETQEIWQGDADEHFHLDFLLAACAVSPKPFAAFSMQASIEIPLLIESVATFPGSPSCWSSAVLHHAWCSGPRWFEWHLGRKASTPHPCWSRWLQDF